MPSPTPLPNKPISVVHAQVPLPPPNEPEPPQSTWPVPTLNLRVENLSHAGAAIFFSSIDPTKALEAAVIASFEWLYTHKSVPTHVKLITLVLRAMDGIAYTTGSHTEKEIHFSLDYILSSKQRAKDEIEGVLTHEVVHCFQYNAKGTAPGGLIEGIADYVRLRAGFTPPHWTRTGGDKWDAGYQTTGYFLDWIENRYEQGTVRELNEGMKGREWEEKIFKKLTGRKVGKLWKMYCAYLEGGEAAVLNISETDDEN